MIHIPSPDPSYGAKLDRSHTQPSVALILVSFPFLFAATAKADNNDVQVAEDNHRWGQHRSVMEGHNQLVPLELPDLIGDGLYFEEGVAAKEVTVKLLRFSKRTGVLVHWCFSPHPSCA